MQDKEEHKRVIHDIASDSPFWYHHPAWHPPETGRGYSKCYHFCIWPLVISGQRGTIDVVLCILSGCCPSSPVKIIDLVSYSVVKDGVGGGGVCRMEVSTSYCSWHPSSTEGQQSPQSSEAASDPSGCSLSAIGYWARPTLIWSTRAGLLREHFKNPLKVGCALCRGVSCVLSRYIPAEPNLNQCLRGEKLKIVSPALWETRSILGDRI